MHKLRRLQISLILSACAILTAGCNRGDETSGVGADGSASAVLWDGSLSDLKAVDENSPFAGVLADCVRIRRASDSCFLGTLPLIGQEIENPSIDDIMSRVLVSHDWMAGRFRDLLRDLPPDILTLLKATTAVVIDADIRPSFYTPNTGAIYLDPSILWLNADERDTINKRKDFRDTYGDDLQFESVARYVNGNRRAYRNYSLDANVTRTLDDILYLVAQVLYHELSHANDSFPVGIRASLDGTKTVYQTYLDNSKSVARTLAEKFPLKNNFLFDMVKLLTIGLVPLDSQKEITGEYMGSQMEDDGANDIYNYATREMSLSGATLREDVAMLFEEAMMKFHFNLDRDVAFLWKNPAGKKCDDFTIQWGRRGRLADPNVKERARLVVREILPEMGDVLFIDTLDAQQVLPKGRGWCSVLEPDGTPRSASKSVMAILYGLTGEAEALTDNLRPGL